MVTKIEATSVKADNDVKKVDERAPEGDVQLREPEGLIVVAGVLGVEITEGQKATDQRVETKQARPELKPVQSEPLSISPEKARQIHRLVWENNWDQMKPEEFVATLVMFLNTVSRNSDRGAAIPVVSGVLPLEKKIAKLLDNKLHNTFESRRLLNESTATLEHFKMYKKGVAHFIKSAPEVSSALTDLENPVGQLFERLKAVTATLATMAGRTFESTESPSP